MILVNLRVRLGSRVSDVDEPESKVGFTSGVEYHGVCLRLHRSPDLKSLQGHLVPLSTM